MSDIFLHYKDVIPGSEQKNIEKNIIGDQELGKKVSILSRNIRDGNCIIMGEECRTKMLCRAVCIEIGKETEHILFATVDKNFKWNNALGSIRRMCEFDKGYKHYFVIEHCHNNVDEVGRLCGEIINQSQNLTNAGFLLTLQKTGEINELLKLFPENWYVLDLQPKLGKIENPYLNRGRIKSLEEFYGRKDEIKDIYDNIGFKDNPQGVVVVGERRIGKSSLLYNAYLRKNEYLKNPNDYIFIFLDMQGETINSSEDFFRILLIKLEQEFGIPIEINDKLTNYENLKDVILPRLADKGYKTVLFIDEYDVLALNKNISSTFYGNLRYIVQNYPVGYVVATFMEPETLTKESGSPLLNVAHPIHLGLFKREEALELIEKPSMDGCVSLKDDAEYILDIAGQHPLFAQIACSKLFECKSRNSLIDYKKIKRKFLDESIYHFNNLWKKYLNNKEKNVIIMLARGDPIKDSEKYVMDNLVRKGYVIEDKEKYCIFSSAFKEFVKNRTDSRPENSGGVKQDVSKAPVYGTESKKSTIGEMHPKIEKKLEIFEYGDVVLLLGKKSTKYYDNVVLNPLKHLLNEKDMHGVYLSLGRPYERILGDMKKIGINLENLLFIECASNREGTSSDGKCKYVSNLASLELIHLLINQQVQEIDADRKFLFIDDLSSFFKIGDDMIKPIEQLIPNILNNAQQTNIGVAIASIKENTPEELISRIESYCNEVIHM